MKNLNNKKKVNPFLLFFKKKKHNKINKFSLTFKHSIF